MEALVTEPYSVTSHLLHKLSSRQPEMLLESRLLLVCNIHEENRHGCQHTPEFNYSAKPVLWGEEASFVHVHELIVWAYVHLAETCDGLYTKVFILLAHTAVSHSCMCMLTASRYCVGVRGMIRFLTKTRRECTHRRKATAPRASVISCSPCLSSALLFTPTFHHRYVFSLFIKKERRCASALRSSRGWNFFVPVTTALYIFYAYLHCKANVHRARGCHPTDRARLERYSNSIQLKPVCKF